VIPFVVAPLTGLTVLVTRPALQAASLCARIEAAGGTAISFPAIEIERIEAATASGHDLIIFVSANAVVHGAHLVRRGPETRVAAIGRATAAALAAAGLPADIVPATGADSETLLDHPALAARSITRVLIVRGTDGRELLQTSFRARGVSVDTREVYRRVKTSVEPARVTSLEKLWSEDGFDAVTITSIDNLRLLIDLLSEQGRELLRTTPALVASRRIASALEESGLRGGAIVARGADDVAMIDALARFNTRDRTN
jgi:uroporphyrinogen-III synthase